MWKGLDLYSPENLDHSLKVSESIWKSKCVNKPWLPNPESVLYVMQKSIDLGLPPQVGLEEIQQITSKDGRALGRWFISIAAARALILNAGGKVEIVEESKEKIRLKMTRYNNDGVPQEHLEEVLYAELQASGVANSDTFKKYPRQIFRAAAFRRAAVLLFSDVLLGCVPVDFGVDSPEILDITEEGLVKGVDPGAVSSSDARPKKRGRPAKTDIETAEPAAGAAQPAHEPEPVKTEPQPQIPAPDKMVHPDGKGSWGPKPPEPGYPTDQISKAHAAVGEIWNPKTKKWEPNKVVQDPDPEPGQEEFSPPSDDFDLETDQGKPAMFDMNNEQHRQLLTEALHKGGFSAADKAILKKTFLGWVLKNPVAAELTQLVGGLGACISAQAS